MHCSRRRFIIVAASLASTPIWVNDAQADAPVLSESDPTAQALGYKANAAQVDKAKHANFQAGQSCANCNFYQGKPGEAMGPCQVFGGKLVNAKGWCASYVKKT